MRIGILALQGAFLEHKKMLDKLNIESKYIRQKKDLEGIDALILPGGESTVMGKLLIDLDIKDEMIRLIKKGLPTFGTCAGMILLADELINDTRIHLSCMPIKVKRNAYGRQTGSFKTTENFKGIGNIPMVFIRGPYVEDLSNDVEILAKIDGNIVAVRKDNILATAYHPELTDNTKVHEYFINMIKNVEKK